MAATDSVTVTMTETVSYEITLTHDRLAELLDVPVAAVPGLLADVEHWSAAGPVEDSYDLLDEIDCDTYRAGSEDRSWASPGRQRDRTGPARPADHRPGRDHRRSARRGGRPQRAPRAGTDRAGHERRRRDRASR